LSGGGVRGLAHIGVLKVLEREQIPIDLLAGTSMGGLVAAAYAAGLSPEEIEEEALRLSNPRRLITFIDRARDRRGLIKGKRITEYLAKRLGAVDFDELRLPLSLLAVDLNEGESVVLREGQLMEAVRATIALPGVFTPVERGDQLLVDGGLLNNLPVDVVREMGADIVIGVDVATSAKVVALFTERMHNRRLVPDGLVNTLEVMWRSVAIMREEISNRCLENAKPDLLIQPSISHLVTTLTGFSRAAEVIEAGEQAMEDELPRLRETLERRPHRGLGYVSKWLKRTVMGG
jgi:NTE family protein